MQKLRQSFKEQNRQNLKSKIVFQILTGKIMENIYHDFKMFLKSLKHIKKLNFSANNFKTF